MLLKRESFQTRLASPEKTIVIFSLFDNDDNTNGGWPIMQLFATSLEMNFAFKGDSIGRLSDKIRSLEDTRSYKM